MPMETLEGNIERITYYNAESGYCVLRLSPHQPALNRKNVLITVVGTMPELQPGENIKITGTWSNHPVHGQQFKAETVMQMRPATLEGVRRYLGSGLIKGIGPVRAKMIVDFFGKNTLDVLDRTPERIREVPGIGKHFASIVIRAWAEQRAIKDVMLFLQGHQINTALAVKIYKTYGDESLEVVQQDPYRMVKDIHGVGFRTADRIARQVGLPEYAPTRLVAGLLFTLNEAGNDGHLYLPTVELLDQATEILNVERPRLEETLTRMHQTGDLILEDVPDTQSARTLQVAYHPAFYHSERGVALRLHTMLDTEESRLVRLQKMNTEGWDALIRTITATDNITLTAQQYGAVRITLTNKVSILTGGPGTGKTTTLKTIIGVLESTGHKFRLASPTGRAAKRLSEATGHPAQTIHRLLAYSPQEGFIYNETNKLDTAMVVVDEASMLDLALFYNLLKALSPETHLLLVGDVDQLPSVGAGDVLRDLIKSSLFPVIRLDTIFRQAGNSLIIQNAHQINKGELPDTNNRSEDFFFFGAEEPEAAAELLVDIVKNRIPARFNYRAIEDIQVLAPMYQGRIGVNTLNEALQNALNPNDSRKAERLLQGTLFRMGDKVMQTRNDYEKEVFNGDIGFVHSFDLEEQLMRVSVDGRLVDYDWGETDSLTLAYAISVHKSQGAEYPVVVLPVMTQHYMMLQRNLLYTAVTRAKKMVVLVGTRKAIGIAVKNNTVAKRYSALAWRLL